MIKYRDFSAEAWNGNLSILIAVGDPYQSVEVIKKAKAFLKSKNESIVFEKFSTPDYQLSDALEQYKVFGLFGEQRCVEFSTDKELSSSTNKNHYNEQNALLEMVDSLNVGNYLLIQIEKAHASKWLDKIKKSFYYIDCSLAKESRKEIRNWLGVCAQERGLNLNTNGAYELIDRIGIKRSLLEKALTLMELSIDASKLWDKTQIEGFFTEELEHAVFDLTDALGDKDLKKSLHLMNWFHNRGRPSVELIGILRSQYRKILVSKEHENDRDQNVLMKKLKLPKWICEKTLSQARKYNLQKLKKIYTELHNLDKNLKSLKLNDKDQFEMFILKLFFA